MHNMMTMIDDDGLQRRRHRVLQRRVFFSKVCTLLNEKVRKFIKPNSISAAFHSRSLKVHMK